MTFPTAPFSMYAYGFFIAASICLMGTSLGTTHWIDFEVNDQKFYFGLFKVCSTQECSSYDDPAKIHLTPGSLEVLNTIIGLCIVAIVLYTFTLMILAHLVLGRSMSVTSKNHGHATLCLCILGAIFALAGVGKFVNDNDVDVQPNVSIDYTFYWSYGYSLYCASLSGVVSFLGGVFAMMAVGFLFNSQQPGKIVFQQQTGPNIQVMSSNVNTNTNIQAMQPQSSGWNQPGEMPNNLTAMSTPVQGQTWGCPPKY